MLTPAARRLIVNADDLGQHQAINLGVARAVRAGIVTSASLMVRWPAAAEAAGWAREHPEVSVGLHLDLGEWTVVDGEWRQLYQVVDVDDIDAVAAELDRQVAQFVRLLGRPPSHLDSHQHVHRAGAAHALVVSLGERLGVDVRGSHGPSYCGDFYGQYGAGEPYPDGIRFEALLAILDRLGTGTTELGCHPAAGDVATLDSMYRRERLDELEVLCDPRLKPELARRGIELVPHGAHVATA